MDFVNWILLSLGGICFALLLFLVDINVAHYNLGRYTMDVLNLILLSVGGICLALALFILSLDPPPRHPGEEKRKTRASLKSKS